MEQVANALEKRISSLNAGLSRSSGLGRNSDVPEGTCQSLLRAASLGLHTLLLFSCFPLLSLDKNERICL